MNGKENEKKPRKRCRPRLDRALSSSLVLSSFWMGCFVPETTMSFSPAQTVSSRRRQGSSMDMIQTMGSAGLSRYFQAILSRNNGRQRFVTGKYPVIVSVEENPTQKWLKKEGATSVLLVNDTTIDKSLASYDRFQWLEDAERQELHDRYASISLELLAEIHMTKPGYVQIMSNQGAGSSAETVRDYGTTTRWNRWQNSTLYQQLILDELTNRPPTTSAAHDKLWVTGFSLTARKGFLQSMDVNSGLIESVNARSESMTLWPNEVSSVPKTLIGREDKLKDDALLISDGFLVPGKDRGGIYLCQKPGNPHSEWTVSLTNREGERWFYHRAVWVDLTGDGRKSILTARAKLRKVSGNDYSKNGFFGGRFNKANNNDEDRRPKNGQLVWLEMPKPHHFDEATGTPLEEDGTLFDPFSSRHLPWKEHILARGPDVMFSIADMDSSDDTIEVISSQFFDKKVTLHSIKRGPKPRVTFTRVIDDRCGAAFGGILADLREGVGQNSPFQTSGSSIVIDSGSTVESLQAGDSFTHILVTSHECDYAEKDTRNTPLRDFNEEYDGGGHNGLNGGQQHHSSETIEGGSLFAYRVPQGSKDAWKTEPWLRTRVASGFKVALKPLNVINPGAPGFVYTFHVKSNDRLARKRPMIAVAGDCAESAFLFRPEKMVDSSSHQSHLKHHLQSRQLGSDPSARYKLMCEIKCGATVGSLAVGYDNLCSVEQESGYAKLYVPCFEKDKILVFALGSGDDGDETKEETEFAVEDDWRELASARKSLVV